MFFLGERTKSVEEGLRLAETMIATGQAREKFRQGIALQGGDESVIDDPQHVFPKARFHLNVLSAEKGFITGTNCENLGTALAMLGGGREKKDDKIDYAVGLEFHKRIGDSVEKSEPLATIHYNSDAKLAEAKSLIASSYFVGPDVPASPPVLIHKILGA
jgi:pyrimidine-nucleoside phosphorylase